MEEHAREPVARIALIGDHQPAVTAHRAIPIAIDLAAKRAGVAVSATWVATDTIPRAARERLEGFSGIWCVPASPYASTEGALRAIGFARKQGRPYLGTCGGFQHALLEYARSEWGLTDAAHAELDPGAADPVIAPLACSLVEQQGNVRFVPGSRLRAIYGQDEATEGYHCSYGLSRRFEAKLESGPLAVAARDAAGEVRAVELGGHPFFIATLYQPERSALTGAAHPLITAFVASASHANPLGNR